MYTTVLQIINGFSRKDLFFIAFYELALHVRANVGDTFKGSFVENVKLEYDRIILVN